MAEEKLIGVLRLDISSLSKDVAQANNLLKSVGKGVNLDLGTAFKQQIAEVIGEVKKFAKAAQDAAAQAAKVSAATRVATGSRSSSGGAKAVETEAAQIKKLGDAYVRLSQLQKQQLAAPKGSSWYEELQHQIESTGRYIDELSSKMNDGARAQAASLQRVIKAYDDLNIARRKAETQAGAKKDAADQATAVKQERAALQEITNLYKR